MEQSAHSHEWVRSLLAALKTNVLSRSIELEEPFLDCSMSVDGCCNGAEDCVEVVEGMRGPLEGASGSSRRYFWVDGGGYDE